MKSLLFKYVLVFMALFTTMYQPLHVIKHGLLESESTFQKIGIDLNDENDCENKDNKLKNHYDCFICNFTLIADFHDSNFYESFQITDKISEKYSFYSIPFHGRYDFNDFSLRAPPYSI